MKVPGQSCLEYFCDLPQLGEKLGGGLAGNFDALLRPSVCSRHTKAGSRLVKCVCGAPFAGPEGPSHTHCQEHILG